MIEIPKPSWPLIFAERMQCQNVRWITNYDKAECGHYLVAILLIVCFCRLFRFQGLCRCINITLLDVVHLCALVCCFSYTARVLNPMYMAFGRCSMTDFAKQMLQISNPVDSE